MTDKASIEIDGITVDPLSVVAETSSMAPVVHNLVVRIAVEVLLHELQESDVDVSEHTLCDFLAADIRQGQAQEAYLDIARCVIAPPPRPSFFDSVRRVIAPLAPRPVLAPQWVWTDTLDVQLQDGAVVFFCRAQPIKSSIV